MMDTLWISRVAGAQPIAQITHTTLLFKRLKIQMESPFGSFKFNSTVELVGVNHSQNWALSKNGEASCFKCTDKLTT